MTSIDYTSQLRSFFKSQIVDPNKYVVEWPNTLLDENDLDKNNVWMRFNILLSDRKQVSTGQTSRIRQLGLCVIQIFGKQDTGELDVYKVVDVIIPIMQTKMLVGGVVLETPKIEIIGKREGRWQVNVTCPWHFDELM